MATGFKSADKLGKDNSANHPNTMREGNTLGDTRNAALNAKQAGQQPPRMSADQRAGLMNAPDESKAQREQDEKNSAIDKNMDAGRRKDAADTADWNQRVAGLKNQGKPAVSDPKPPTAATKTAASRPAEDTKAVAPPANVPYRGTPDINPATASGGSGLRGRFARGFQNLAGSNRNKAIAGGGIGVFLISFLLLGASPLLGELKLSHFMENMTKRGFRYLTHDYVSRQRLIMKYWLKENIDPTFDPHSSIVNYDRSMIKNLYGKLRGDDRMRKKLEDAGFQVTTKTDINFPAGRITTIRYQGHELNQNSFEVEYHYMFDPGTAAERAAKANVAHDISLVAEDALGGGKIMRRLNSRRLQIITGTKLHWIDKLTGPFDKIRREIENEIVVFLERQGLSKYAAAQIINLLLGGKIDSTAAQEIANSSADGLISAADTKVLTTEVVKTTVSDALRTSLAKVGFDATNPVGWAMLIIGAECTINKLGTDGYNQLAMLAKWKAGAEYLTQFVAMESALSQVHADTSGTNKAAGVTGTGAVGAAVAGLFNSTNSDTVNALLELLNDKANRDYSQSNNFRRAAGETVPYSHTDDCSTGYELCDQMRPQTMADQNFLGWGLKRMRDDPFSNSFFAKYVTFLGPRGVATPFLCNALDAIGNLLTLPGPALVLIEQIPEIKDFTSQGADAILQHVIMPMVGWIIPPVVDAETRGPNLANAVAAGSLHASGLIMRTFCGDPTPLNLDASNKCLLSGGDLLATNAAVDQEQTAEEQSKPLLDRMASLNNPRSALSRVLASAPTTPRQIIAQFAALPRFFSSDGIIHGIAAAGPAATNLMSGTAVAAPGDEEPTGVDVYGYTEGCLANTKLNDGAVEACKGMDKWDTQVACTMFAGDTEGKDVPAECNDGLDPQATASAGSDLATLDWTTLVDHPGPNPIANFFANLNPLRAWSY